jgi:hypothetical protein
MVGKGRGSFVVWMNEKGMERNGKDWRAFVFAEVSYAS